MPTLELSEKEIKNTSIYFAPCIKCGGVDISFNDNGYRTFNYATAKCKNKLCQRAVLFPCSYNVRVADIVQVWNRENDIDLIVKRKKAEMKELIEKTLPSLRAQAKELAQLKRTRKRMEENGIAAKPLPLNSIYGGMNGHDRINDYAIDEINKVYLSIREKDGFVL